MFGSAASAFSGNNNNNNNGNNDFPTDEEVFGNIDPNDETVTYEGQGGTDYEGQG